MSLFVEVITLDYCWKAFSLQNNTFYTHCISGHLEPDSNEIEFFVSLEVSLTLRNGGQER